MNVIISQLRYGLVPNGGRLYYLLRSQPPLLTQMVDLYYTSTLNRTFLEEMLPILDAEYQFWAQNRTLKDGPYANLSMYRSLLTDPRPEAFREDTNTSRNACKAHLINSHHVICFAINLTLVCACVLAGMCTIPRTSLCVVSIHSLCS